MLPILQIGPLALQVPGLFIIIGIWLGLSLSEHLATRFHSNASTLYNLTFISLIAGLIGARLSFAAQHSAAFVDAPLNIFSLNPGLLDPVGGVAIGLLTALVFGNRQKLHLFHTLDALTPMLAVTMIGFHLANFASGKAFGTQTSLPWGIHLWGLDRHPVQIYDSILSILILGWLWYHTREKANPALGLPGGIFWGFLSISATARLFTEAFRGDSVLVVNNLRIAQILAWILLALSLYMQLRLEKAHAPQG